MIFTLSAERVKKWKQNQKKSNGPSRKPVGIRNMSILKESKAKDKTCLNELRALPIHLKVGAGIALGGKKKKKSNQSLQE